MLKILLARSSSPLQDWRRSVDCCNGSGIVEVHAKAGMTPGMPKQLLLSMAAPSTQSI